MPSLKPIVFTDDVAPTNSRTFTPNGISDDGTAQLINLTGTPAESATLQYGMRQAGSSRYNGKLRLAIPAVVTETINGVNVPKVDHSDFVEVRPSFSPRSTLEQRKAALRMAAELMHPDTGNADVIASFCGLERAW